MNIPSHIINIQNGWETEKAQQAWGDIEAQLQNYCNNIICFFEQ